jgi:indolepyruvate ferredoxin oxidoreductase alpha subunit
VALFGDSAFFHTSIPAICNAVHNRSDILMVVLDNKSTASTGHQPHPGIGKDAMEHKAPALSIEHIARACGVEQIHLVSYDEYDSILTDVFQETLSTHELALVVVQTRPVNSRIFP